MKRERAEHPIALEWKVKVKVESGSFHALSAKIE
jgi:hypothetical protein